MSFDIPEHIRDLALRTAAPDALSDEARRSRFGPLADLSVRAGQVWRLTVADLVHLVVVLDTPADTDVEVRAAPMTIDPPAEDSECLVADETTTAFAVPVTIWAGLARDIPLRVFADILDALDEQIVEACRAVSRRVAIDTWPAGVRPGQGPQSLFDPSVEVRAELEDDLDTFLSTPGVSVAEPDEVPKPLSASVGQVINALEVTQPVAMRVLKGKYPLTPEQANKLSAVTGIPVTDVMQSVQRPPAALVATVEHPSMRQDLRAWADAHGISEMDARERAAYAVYALAARETGAVDWRERLRRWLDGRLASEAPGA